MSHGHADDAGLTSVEDHLAEILGTIVPLAPTELSLGDVLGLVLAEDVAAASALPSFDNSAMDGYAVHVEDVAAATEENPVTLPVMAEVAAGDTGALRAVPGHQHPDHDRRDAAARDRGRRAGGVDRRRQRSGSPSAPRRTTATRYAWPAGTRRPARSWSPRGPGSARCTSR